MKKTMIALVALSGLAMADTIDKDILTIPDSITRISNAPTGWKQTIGKPSDINAADVATDLALKSGANSFIPNGWSWALANTDGATGVNSDVSTEPAWQAFEFKGRQGYGGEFVAGVVDVADLISTTANATGISTLTFGFQKTSGQSDLTFSVWHWDGESSSATALVAKTNDLTTDLTGNSFSWTGAELTNGKILVVFNEFSAGQSNMIAQWKATATLNTATVPEPATATLSLLALVGLAARRRRH